MYLIGVWARSSVVPHRPTFQTRFIFREEFNLFGKTTYLIILELVPDVWINFLRWHIQRHRWDRPFIPFVRSGRRSPIGVVVVDQCLKYLPSTSWSVFEIPIVDIVVDPILSRRIQAIEDDLLDDVGRLSMRRTGFQKPLVVLPNLCKCFPWLLSESRDLLSESSCLCRRKELVEEQVL